MVLMRNNNLKDSHYKEGKRSKDFISVKVNKEKDEADVDVNINGKGLIVAAMAIVLPSAICMLGINSLAKKILKKQKKNKINQE